MIATCGHNVKSGISCSINDGQIFSDGTKAITYGTFCSDCFFKYYLAGNIENEDMDEFIEKLVSWTEKYADNSRNSLKKRDCHDPSR